MIEFLYISVADGAAAGRSILLRGENPLNYIAGNAETLMETTVREDGALGTSA
jgi:hypothetical protein